MTDPKLLPASIRSWAEATLGPLAAVLDASGARPASRVWETVRQSADARFFMRVPSSPTSYIRETFAHRHAVPFLGSGRATFEVYRRGQLFMPLGWPTEPTGGDR
ncbi:hypothetical protein GCM10010344_71070 [Streptomyces bluensis]|nr:hypothetical protein GCM10010344_71070 [Streptomyces bluensis]